MDPVIGGLLAGGLVGGLDLFGGLLTNSANAAEGARNRRFVAAMYKKRYQNTTADMRKAGLNPVLAAMNGGAVGSVPSPGGLPTFDNALGSAANSAMSAAQSVASIRKTEADSANVDANRKLTEAKTIGEVSKNEYLPDKLKSELEKSQAEALLVGARAANAKDLAQIELGRGRLENENLGHSAVGKFLDNEIKGRSPEYTMSASERRWLERIKASLGAVNSAAGSFLSGAKALRYFR